MRDVAGRERPGEESGLTRWRSLARPLLVAVALALAGAALAAEPDAAASSPATALPEVAPEVEEVQACVARNLPARSLRQEVLLEQSDASGVAQALGAELFWKRGEDGRSRVLVRVTRPADVRGSAFLAIEGDGEPDLFTYLPELRNVRRITARTISGSLFGTDFSYEDLLRLQTMSGRTRIERLPDATLDGRPTWVVAASPGPDGGSAYGRVVTHVDRETCVPLKTEMFSRSGGLAKEMTVAVDRIQPEGDRQVPREVVLRDLENGSRTVLTVKEIALDEDLPDSLFSQSALAKGR